LCVQQKPENRPNMSSVVFMLKGENLLPKPNEPGFYAGRDITNSIGYQPINEASITVVWIKYFSNVLKFGFYKYKGENSILL